MTLVAAAALALASPAACTPAVSYRHVLYIGTPLRRSVVLTGRLRGTVPACNDVGIQKPPGAPVGLRRIRGVEPRVAVALPGQRQIAYVATGLFPQVPSFPLHHAIYGSRRLPRECRRPHSDVALLVKGIVASTPGPGGLLLIRARGHIRYVFVDAGTRLGFPSTRRLVAGTRVRVVATPCGRKLVAVAMSRA